MNHNNDLNLFLEPDLRTPLHPLSEYEITTSHSLYYPDTDFSIKNDIQKWYEKYQKLSAFKCHDWNQFSDPNRYTYFKYISEKIEKTYTIQGLFEMTKSSRYYGELSADWIEKLQLLYAPQIYPAHAMQMIISYIGQMAPSSRIVIASSLQAANEISRIQTISENMSLVFNCFKDLNETSLSLWQNSPLYQPLRKLMEEALIVYDWGEAFVALNLCIKPLFDEFFLHQFSLQSLFNGDHLTSNIAYLKYQDSEWQLSWSLELTKVVLAQNPEFRFYLQTWLKKWTQQSLDAFVPLCDFFEYSQISRTDLLNFQNRILAQIDIRLEAMN